MAKENKKQEGNKPEEKFRAGALCVTVWKNTAQNDKGESFVNRSVTFERSYKDKSGNWQNTNSVRQADLPKLVMLLNDAFRFCVTTKHDSEDD